MRSVTGAQPSQAHIEVANFGLPLPPSAPLHAKFIDVGSVGQSRQTAYDWKFDRADIAIAQHFPSDAQQPTILGVITLENLAP